MNSDRMRVDSWQLADQRFATCENLKDVVQQLEVDYRAQGMVICSVAVNGMSLSEIDESRLASTLKSDINFIEIHAESPEQLLLSTIQGQIELSQEIDRVAQVAADNFRRGQIKAAQDQVLKVFDACRWFTDALVAVKGSPSWMKSLKLDESAWAMAETQFQRVIAEMVKSLEANDMVLLADLLEYELANSLAAWQEILKKLAKVLT